MDPRLVSISDKRHLASERFAEISSLFNFYNLNRGYQPFVLLPFVSQTSVNFIENQLNLKSSSKHFSTS